MQEATKKSFQINLLIAARRIEILRENKSGWSKKNPFGIDF